MQDYIWVTGIILKQSLVGEYDRRISLLTKEKGKVAAFARGARKPGNRLAAATNPFSFGSFRLYEGRNAYTLAEADIRNYFEELRSDYIGACYGMYFAEVTDFCWQLRRNGRRDRHWVYGSRSRRGIGTRLADGWQDLVRDPPFELLGLRLVGAKDDRVQSALVYNNQTLCAAALSRMTLSQIQCHFLILIQPLCNSG